MTDPQAQALREAIEKMSEAHAKNTLYRIFGKLERVGRNNYTKEDAQRDIEEIHAAEIGRPQIFKR
ncbi:hypothetical protein NST68_21355 [Paenibacillus sp. FSL E2-0230]|uniref:hypothetical protein n=1 Tax=Paenibacillus sp. FSL E2-0230 TaxID=2954727 RepID=UPI0030CD5147